MFSLEEFQAALPVIRAVVAPTPLYAWPLLKERTGIRLLVKHETHTPTGAFKIRGGLVYIDRLRRERPEVSGIISATRGNHGQSLALAGTRAGLKVVIVVPHGNSVEKNQAMRAFGATLIEHGRDFDEARLYAKNLAAERGLDYVPTFAPALVLGVASYAHELLSAAPDLDAIYVPIGLGSAICAMILTRDLMGLKVPIIGVVAEKANAYRLSFEAGRIITTENALTFADGIATHVPDEIAFSVIRQGADHLVEVSEGEIAEAIRLYFTETHTLTEGAGAAALAGALKERDALQGKRVAVIASGQNIDAAWMHTVLEFGVPKVG